MFVPRVKFLSPSKSKRLDFISNWHSPSDSTLKLLKQQLEKEKQTIILNVIKK